MINSERFASWTIEMAQAWENETRYLVAEGMPEEQAEEHALKSVAKTYGVEQPPEKK